MKKNFRKRILVLIICIGLKMSFSGCSKEDEQQERPNIVYVLTDDLGYGDISAFNAKSKIMTPNIDQMAAEGMKFTDAHTSSAVCTPTRYGILTGRYNWRSKLKSGVLTGKSKALIHNDRTTVASMLQDNGYHTAFMGKWHLGWDWHMKDSTNFGGEGWDAKDFDNIDFSKPVKNNPNDLGFTYFYGHSGSLDMAPYVYVENGNTTQLPDTLTVNTGKYSWWREGPTSRDFVHEDVTQNLFRRAELFIENRAIEKTPFFLYLALPSPHTPILPTEKWQGKSGLNPYGDFVMEVDDLMGYLLKTIKDAGIEENTIVIFTSDNGCSPAAKIGELEEKEHFSNSIYRGHKADIYEGGHRVPFVVKWPKRIKPGSVSDETICTTDLMATCADLIDYKIKANEGEDSYSLLPVLTGEVLGKPLREATVHHSINGSFAIRKGDWKLIMCAGSGGWCYPTPSDVKKIENLPEIQLYNLKDDPGETKNLEANYSDKVVELRTLLTKYILDGRSTPGKKQNNDDIDFEWKQISFTK